MSSSNALANTAKSVEKRSMAELESFGVANLKSSDIGKAPRFLGLLPTSMAVLMVYIYSLSCRFGVSFIISLYRVLIFSYNYCLFLDFFFA